MDSTWRRHDRRSSLTADADAGGTINFRRLRDPHAGSGPCAAAHDLATGQTERHCKGAGQPRRNLQRHAGGPHSILLSALVLLSTLQAPVMA